MSQAGYTPIQLYYSTTAAAAPSAGNLANGELAVNITDGKLFYKDNGGVVRVLATAAGSAGDVVGPGSSTDNALVRFDGTTGKLVQNSVGVLSDAGALSGLTSVAATTFTGALTGNASTATTLQTSRTIWGQSFDGSANVTGALTGVTDLTASGSLTLSGGTANGVAYLNGSKVLTSGSALTFDGSTLTSSAFSGSGAALTNLNASNLASGTVATARLASGTANSTTYLRGDQTWASIPSSTPGGSNTQVQYNNSGSFGGSANLTFDGTTLKAANTINVPNTFGFKNRIINGDMRIDQRNNGAAISSNSAATTAFPVDRLASFAATAARYSCQQNQGNVTRPAGFTNYAGFTAIASNSPGSTEANIAYQWIEGNNIADLGFGTASASSVTLSFWVRSSLTGQHSGSLINGSQNRGYPFTFTINAANTWEQKTITVPGDTTGTWATDNGQGLGVIFNLGSGSSRLSTANSWQAGQLYGVTGSVNVLGTNGATFYITGVQLEAGSVATPFDFRPYGTELALCQRYYNVVRAVLRGADYSNVYPTVNWTQQMRAAPTTTLSSGTASLDSTNIGAYQNGAHSGGSPIALNILASAEL